MPWSLRGAPHRLVQRGLLIAQRRKVGQLDGHLVQWHEARVPYGAKTWPYVTPLGDSHNFFANTGGRGEMIKAPMVLQDLRRRIYAKAKAEPSLRFGAVRSRLQDRDVASRVQTRLGK